MPGLSRSERPTSHKHKKAQATSPQCSARVLGFYNLIYNLKNLAGMATVLGHQNLNQRAQRVIRSLGQGQKKKGRKRPPRAQRHIISSSVLYDGSKKKKKPWQCSCASILYSTVLFNIQYSSTTSTVYVDYCAQYHNIYHILIATHRVRPYHI